MKTVDAYNFDAAEIEKLHPREKIKYFCYNCGKEQIKNAESVWQKMYKGPLLCIGCNVSISKTKCKHIKIEDNSFIKNIEEIKNFNVSSRKNTIHFECEVCKEKSSEKLAVFLKRTQLICSKCYHENRMEKRFGTKSILKKEYHNGVNISHTDEGIFNTRLGIVRNLWLENFDKRKMTLNKYNWQIIDVDYRVGTVLIRRNCCGEYKKFLMGTEKISRMKCKCNTSRAEPASYKERELLSRCKKEFPEYKITCNKRGWNSFRKNNAKGNYEIDIFFEDINLGIEFNGIYWHNKANQKREQYKTMIAKKNNIDIIHIWEDEWDDSPDMCIEYIKNVIGEKYDYKNT